MFDPSGKLVETLVSKKEDASLRRIKLNNAKYPKGHYYVNSNIDNISQTNRLIVIKDSDTIKGNKLIEELKKRNIVFKPLKIEGKYYGENFLLCVEAGKKELCRRLRIPEKNFFPEPWLSIESGEKNKRLSAYNTNLRKQSRSLRKLKRQQK